MLKKLFGKGKQAAIDATKTTAETAGNITGSAIRGTAKGIYKGVTGKTEEEIISDKVEKETQYQIRKAEREQERQIAAKERKIMNWAWLIFVGSISVMTLVFIGGTGISASSLGAVLKDRWVAYIIPLVLLFLVGSFSRTIAEEI